MVFKFKEQNDKGKIGEKNFLKFYEPHFDKLEWLCEAEDKTGPDFRIGKKLVELKTDSYDMNKTDNFFIEYYSDEWKKTIGGPWQAREKGCDFFVYQFINHNYFVWFQLCDEFFAVLDEMRIKAGVARPPNPGYHSYGYKINRNILIKSMEKLSTGSKKLVIVDDFNA